MSSAGTIQLVSLATWRSWTISDPARSVDGQCTPTAPSPSRQGRTPSTSPLLVPSRADPSPRSVSVDRMKGTIGPTGRGATRIGSRCTSKRRRHHTRPEAPPVSTSTITTSITPGSGNRTSTVCAALDTTIASPSGWPPDRITIRSGPTDVRSATPTITATRSPTVVSAGAVTDTMVSRRTARPPSSNAAISPATVAANTSTTAAAPVSLAMPNPTAHMRPKNADPGARAYGTARPLRTGGTDAAICADSGRSAVPVEPPRPRSASPDIPVTPSGE